MLDEFMQQLDRKFVILGVGNRLKSDDAAGVVLAEEMKKIFPERTFVAGTAPENYAEKIAQLSPEVLIIIDAVDFEGSPGETRLFAAEEMMNSFSLTHGPGFSLLVKFLKNQQDIDVKLLGIQPLDIAFGEELSPEVEVGILKLLEKVKSRVNP